MKHASLGAVALSITILLAACGGGGGRSPSTALGDPPAGLTPSQVREDIAAIGRSANSLILSDLITTPRSAVVPNERTSCFGSDCEPSWGEPYYDPQTLSQIDPDATLRSGAPQYGINYAEITGRQSVRELDEGLDASVDYRVYGGWLSTNFFGVKVDRWRGQGRYGSIEGLETLLAYSAGTASGSNPVTGSAEWTGLVVALDRTAPDQVVNGQAALTYDFGDATLDVLFSNLRGARAYGDLSWNELAVTNGRFS